jgi:hypothetical protein
MGYYVRVLAESDDVPPVSDLSRHLEEQKHAGSVVLETGDEEDWLQLAVRDSRSEIVAVLERNPVKEGLLGEEEIEEFLEDLEGAKPASAARWLSEYLPSVKCIYAFQILNSIYDANGWDVVDAIKEYVWNRLGGIFQADMEGFSNKEGYHILWQFNDNVEGDWWVAILDGNDWKTFKMDLGRERHREAFLAGKMPEGVIEE